MGTPGSRLKQRVLGKDQQRLGALPMSAGTPCDCRRCLGLHQKPALQQTQHSRHHVDGAAAAEGPLRGWGSQGCPSAATCSAS
jgi:hypothetical protein